jgi:hypothetical protein
MAKKLSITYKKDNPCLTINRVAFHNDKLVYIACANKGVRYPWGKSKIVYIGTTKKGANRIASSAAWRGEVLLYDYGISHLKIHVVTCGRVQGAETWKKLERALLIRFREIFGNVPRANKVGKHLKWRDEKRYFAQEKLDRVIDCFSGKR